MTHPMGQYKRAGGYQVGCLALFVVIGILLGAASYFYFNPVQNSNPFQSDEESANRPPTLTPPPLSAASSQHRILFPNAEAAGTIVEAYKIPGGWDVSNLQNLVGHLEGTPWLGQNGNIVLAGHFEDELGRPGPFRYLYFAEVGDQILLQDTPDSEPHVYEVREVFRTDPSDVEVLRKSDTPRLTLITCDSWDQGSKVYTERLVVIAEPVTTEPKVN
jgi:LPXTG-site transpeptidase (sortase) family protein